jgi:hypothetical protein
VTVPVVVAGTQAVEGEQPDEDGEPGRDLRAPAADRRRAAATFVEIWRDVTRDLLLVGLGEERRLRDPGLLDDLRAVKSVSATALSAFLVRLDDASELIESNVSPELAVDVLLLAWPRGAEAA